MSRFAANTSVSSDRSRAEIEKILQKYGATGFAYGWQGSVAIIGFQMRDRMIRFALPMPDKDSREFWFTPERGTKRSPDAAHAEWEQATRQRWRALALAVKAKLEAVESQITTFEEEFLAHIVVPGGKTMGQVALPQLEHAYKSGKIPPLLGFDGVRS